jgi:hypothetical protein
VSKVKKEKVPGAAAVTEVDDWIKAELARVSEVVETLLARVSMGGADLKALGDRVAAVEAQLREPPAVVETVAAWAAPVDGLRADVAELKESVGNLVARFGR